MTMNLNIDEAAAVQFFLTPKGQEIYKRMTEPGMTVHVEKSEWQYSVKADISAKGFVQCSVHVYSNDPADVTQKAVGILNNLCHELRESGYALANDQPYYATGKGGNAVDQ